MSALDLSTAKWRKSSRSSAQGGNCVEVAELSDIVMVRDSKNPGSTLQLDRASFSRFARALHTA